MGIPSIPDYEPDFAQAMASFWQIKDKQQAAADEQGTSKGATSGGVRAGKHMSPFEALVRRVAHDAGVEADASVGDKTYLPGFYRETKSWDVVLQYKGHALAIVEAKSQGSSLANNFNNRVEEAIGQAADVWKSHERGFLVSPMRPWVGYLMIVEETTSTVDPKHLLVGKAVPPGMSVDRKFDGMSYAQRYAEAFKRLEQERMLDATCVAITKRPGTYSYPDPWLSFGAFVAQLWGRCLQARAVLG